MRTNLFLTLRRLGIALLTLAVATQTGAQPPRLALAGVYEKGIELESYWVSEKLDGVRAYWDGEGFISRGGHHYRAPEWFTRNFPEQPLDGELWMGRGQFAELSGAVRRAEPVDDQWREIRFMVFDLPESGQSFTSRIALMRDALLPPPSPFIAMVKQSPAVSHQQLMEVLDRTVAAGGEGLMLRHGDSYYSTGRSSELLKVKRYSDAEAVVVGHLPGKGKYTGQLGALQVELDNGRQLRLGTGFSDTERASPPEIGAIITYKYYGYTASGLPRFASFLRVRDDEPPSNKASGK
jgi:DNA ligase-1